MLRQSFLVLCLTVSAFGQESHAPDRAAEGPRPTVALVLSGGGARGGAHIGALRALEQAGVPIDLIVGTSIGALVGGLYAVGYTVDDVETIARTLDWNSIFEDKPDRKLLNIDNKERLDRGLFELQFEGFNPSLPTGLIHGQRIHQLLDRLTSFRVFEAGNDFDRFPVRFRAVATDLLTGQPYVFKDGSLSRALHSSMAVPGVFTPVDFADTYLVDGGLANNLPVDVALECGADIVIAVDVSTPLKSKKSEIRTIFDVLDQAISIHIEEHKLRNRELADLVITPELGDLPSADFARITSVIDAGSHAVTARIDDVRNILARRSVMLAPGPARTSQVRAAGQTLRESPAESSGVIPDIVAVEGDDDADQVQPASAGVGESITAETVDRRLSVLYGTNRYERVTYRLDAVRDQTILTYELKRSPSTRLGFSVHYDLDYDFLGSVEMASSGGPIPRSEWQFRGLVGGANGALFQWKNQPFEGSGFNVYPEVYYFAHPRNVFEGSTAVGSVSDERTGFRMNAGWLIGNSARLEGGYRLERVSSVEDPDPVQANVTRRSGLELELLVDTLAQATFPATGHRSRLAFEVQSSTLGSDASHSRFQAQLEQFFELWPGTTLALEGHWGLVSGSEIPYLERLFTGGGHYLSFSSAPFAGLQRDRFNSLHRGLAGVGIRHRLKSMDLGLVRGIYVGAKYQAGVFNKGEQLWRFGRLLHGVGAAVYVDTPYLGPVAMEVGGTSEQDVEVYFSLGHRF